MPSLRFPIRRRKNGIEWSPVDQSLEGAIVTSADKSPPRWAGNAWFRVRLFWDEMRGDFAGRLVKSIVAGAITYPVYLYFVGVERGLSEMLSEAGLQIAWIKAALGAAVIVFVVDTLVALLFRQRGDGVWYENQYIFDDPKRLLTVRVTSDDNDTAFPIRIPGALPGAFAKLQIVADRSDDRVKTSINLAPAKSGIWRSASNSGASGIRLSSKLPVFLLVDCAPEATATTIRVYLLSLTYENKIGAKVI